MAFVKKTWKDRLVEYAGRRKITNTTTNESQIVDVERAEGQISEEGSAFSAANMNDLEQRVADEFSALNKKIDDNKKWTQVGTITTLKTNLTLPSTWNECFIVNTDGFGTMLINTTYGKNGYIVNALSGMLQRWHVVATDTTIQVENFNNNGTWETTSVGSTFYVYYR